MRRDRRRRVLRSLRHGTHNQCTDASAGDVVDTERFDRSISANVALRVGDGHQQSRPPRRRHCRDAAHTEG
jgi:hypothetical protein